MPAFLMEATLYTLHEASYNDFLQRWQAQIMRAGVRKFLQAVTRRIPVRTGFLRGSFSDIRRNFGDEVETITPSVPKGRREYYRYGVSRILKTPTSGIQFATRPEDVLTFQNNVAIFFLDIAINYYRINDQFARIRGAPWNSLLEGGTVFANFLGEAAEFFPDIKEILAKQTIIMKGTRVTKSESQQEVRASRFLKITGL